MTLAEEARRLLDIALDAGAPVVAKLVDRTRNDLSPALFAALPERDLSPAITALEDLRALAALPAPQATAGLTAWIAAARAALGRRTEVLDRRDAAAADPGHDPGLAASVSQLEKTKHELLDDLVTVRWFAAGAAVAPAVAYLRVPRFKDGAPFKHERPVGGTGFLIAPDLVMTAFHVVEARDRVAGEAPASAADRDAQVAALRLMFDYERRDANDRPAGTELAAVALVAFDVGLDVAVLRLAQAQPTRPVTFRAHALPSPEDGVGFAANIVQHPNHEPKKVGLRNNAVYAVDGKQLYYFTDTRGGSSGAPVFDDEWRVIALHTGWDPIVGEEPVYLGRKHAVVNRGTLAARLIDHFADPALGVTLTVG